MNFKKTILLPIIMLFLLPYVLADFQVKVVPVNDHIVINENAAFDVEIKNNYETDQEFRVRNFDYPVWDIFTEPLTNPITIVVPKQSSKSIRIFVRSLQYAQTPVGTYAINAKVDADNVNEQSPLPLTVSIKSTEPLIGGYLPNVRMIVDAPEAVDPRKESFITVSLKNLNPIKYENITVRVIGGLVSGEEYTILEPPGEGTIVNPESEKAVQFKIKMDPESEPGEETMIVEVLYNKRKISSEARKIKVSEYTEMQEMPESKRFLKSTKSVKVTTNNPSYKGIVKLETSPVKNLFISTEPESDYAKEAGGQYLVWDVDFKGSKEITLHVYTNYRPLIAILLLAAIVIALYCLLRSPMTLSKSAPHISRREGGISEVKVMVRVKNRGKSDIDHIEVTDNVHHLADIDKDLSIGSLQPVKILRHPKSGIIIKWYIEKIEGGDERILTYGIKSRLPILGEFTLQPATAKCRANKRNVITSSNRVVIGA